MKKILSLILVVIMAVFFVSCGKENTEDVSNTNQEEQQVIDNNEENLSDEKEEVEGEKEDSNGEVEKNPETKPEVKPETKPETKPEAKPEAKPETNQSVGNVLLADFKAKASSASSALSLAESLLSNSVIAFSGAAMPIEPGFLTGFDNTEIKGFKEGAMFAPMIGTIPFVGYVFTLEDSANASDFISTLKSAANLRWNICTSADEMIAGSSGNKVFFVMCPKSFEQE